MVAPLIGGQAARVVMTLFVCLALFLFIHLYVRKMELTLKAWLIRLGVFWAVLTMSFEFLFGHYVLGHPWAVLLADYNILKGRLWPLVLMVILWGPLVAAKIQGRF